MIYSMKHFLLILSASALALCSCTAEHKDSNTYYGISGVDGLDYEQLLEQFGEPTSKTRIDYADCFDDNNNAILPLYQEYMANPAGDYRKLEWINLQGSGKDLVLYYQASPVKSVFWGYLCPADSIGIVISEYTAPLN